MKRWEVKLIKAVWQRTVVEVQAKNPSDAMEAACIKTRRDLGTDPKWQCTPQVHIQPGPMGSAMDAEEIK